MAKQTVRPVRPNMSKRTELSTMLLVLYGTVYCNKDVMVGGSWEMCPREPMYATIREARTTPAPTTCL